MLTEAEKKSDVYREVMKQFCIEMPNDAVSLMQELIQLTNEFEDAAKFEARVAAKMTRITVGDLPCGVDPDNNDCQKPHFGKYNNEERAIGCDMCFLMVARLAVEAEE